MVSAEHAMDPFGRTIDYLRISVTDRCNERCLYCMPEGYKGWARKADHLSGPEIIRVVEASCALGFRKFRLTGGEPLLREDIAEIAAGIWALPGVQALGVSTNGLRLAKHAKSLKQAGVRSINVSLDALSPAVYRAVTGGKVGEVLAGIEAALEAQFEVVKLNCVLMRGVNEQELWPLVQFAAERCMPVRFIELMPVSSKGVLGEPRFLSVQEAMRILSAHDSLAPLPGYRPGNGPARYYQLAQTGAKVGFIGAITTPDFCESCNKLRLTADGKLRPCLGRHGELDLLPVLRAQGDLGGSIREAILNKPENHQFAECYEPERPMIAIGG
jgi:cyclic pyranopterin phosphate synthase